MFYKMFECFLWALHCSQENHPLRSFDNVLFSSHVASASIKAAKKLRQSAAELVIKCHNSEKLINIVNW